MLETIISKRLITVDWPVYIDDKLFNGDKYNVHDKCTDKCRDITIGNETKVCEHGLSHVKRCILGKSILISGIYIHRVDGKKYKKNLLFTKRKTSKEAVNNWFCDFDRKATSISQLIHKEGKKNFEQFHEFVKWAREIKYYSDNLLGKNELARITALESASENLKSLYKTSVMLLDSLDTTAIYFNPTSAKFSSKKSTDIYSMLHKMKMVLEHSKSNKTRSKIKLNGRVQNKHHLYESFKIIPLSLLQNAIKYRQTGDIDVIFEEDDKKLKMSIVSIGYHISDSEIENIFKRGFRTKKAKQMSVEGSGLGLYVSKVVSDAHDFNISVTSELIQPLNKGLAKNTFTAHIH